MGQQFATHPNPLATLPGKDEDDARRLTLIDTRDLSASTQPCDHLLPTGPHHGQSGALMLSTPACCIRDVLQRRRLGALQQRGIPLRQDSERCLILC
jgi:hypothetical protein